MPATDIESKCGFYFKDKPILNLVILQYEETTFGHHRIKLIYIRYIGLCIV